MNKFQKTYIFLFIFSITGLIGNQELGETTPIYSWLILAVSSFFTVGKIVYLVKKGV